ncbi:MAG TPA: NAD-dependent epimerase/dehydratase family protein [Candidatus Kapabacteria bacterium]|nr:NAD-dependent epimerase/dehydratase family protein [Candidatus Kapabacteria bacterium]
MNILVTGGAGFIGSHIVDAYISLGHNVIIADNFSSGRKDFINPKAKVITVDIRDGGLEQIFRDHQIDVVNHHAAQIDLRKSVEDPIYDASVNILGGLNIYSLCVKYNVKKVIFASTGGAIYGEQISFPADENHPTNPLSPYGIAKLSNEKYLSYFSDQLGLTTVILRYTNVYGPRQNPHGEAGVVAIFADKMLDGKQPTIFGDGLQTRDYVFVGDIARANVAALNYQQSGTFNICTGIETNVNDICDGLRKELKTSLTAKHDPPKKGEQRRSVCSFNRAKEFLGWTPQVSIQEGLRQTAAFFAEQHRK